MVTSRIFLWCRLIISTVTKNRLSFFVTAVLSNRHQSPSAARGQKIETNGRVGEAEKHLSARVLSLLILLLGPLSFLSSHSVLSLLSFLWFWRGDNLRGRRRHGGRWAWQGGGGRRRHGEAEAVGGGPPTPSFPTSVTTRTSGSHRRPTSPPR
jgi:hypothetical protein